LGKKGLFDIQALFDNVTVRFEHIHPFLTPIFDNIAISLSLLAYSSYGSLILLPRFRLLLMPEFAEFCPCLSKILVFIGYFSINGGDFTFPAVDQFV
jgi:hypothetical protein